ncbi:hypothetical protein GCK72_004691 [Caenorhabditis remanei]|uniref:HAT C-terminal dimerisation domain-containing protein n=1 Tax=Caenorhabditis remanei TaxID=31234 RepID=A0A6A5HCU1_CAERE|nr:hypothetical protein GCK72_004691 [Caenorhabditis remanei]KAF1764741.1 hypothetical protein GCK72_004691 [Caenorhabditis remanei]
MPFSDIRCVNHSLNLVAQHMVVPLDAHSLELLPVSKQLEKVSRIFKLAQIISGGLRGNVNACQNLSRLPALPIETRWMNGLKCLKDIIILSDEISLVIGMLPTKVRSAHHELFNESLKVAKSTLLVMEPLLDYNQLYQTQSEVTLHLVLPTYKLLETRFNSLLSGKFDDVSLHDLDSICSETVDALSRSGLAVLPHYYEEFDSVHFAAVYISPKTKKMLSFSCSERQKAKSYILSLLLQEIRLPVTPKPIKSSSSVSKLLSLVSDVYESEHVDALSNESVEDYWKSRRNVYPHLFDVALKVLSVVPSESVCESAFSQAAFLLDKRRTRLSYLKAEYVVLGTQLTNKYPELLP